MSSKVLRASAPNDLINRGGDSFTLAITRDSDIPWRLTVLAHLEHGARALGFIITQPHRATGAPQSRVIAAGALPGAKSWSVQGEPLRAGGSQRDIELDLSVAIGMQVPSFTDLETRTINYRSGVAATVQLEPWERLRGWTARATAPGASVALNNHPPIVIPPGTPVASEVQLWAAKLSFVGTDNYLVEVEGY